LRTAYYVQPGRLCPDRVMRHRERHLPSGCSQGFQTLLYTSKGPVQGHRPRPEHGLIDSSSSRRPHQDLVAKEGYGHTINMYLAAGHRIPLSPFTKPCVCGDRGARYHPCRRRLRLVRELCADPLLALASLLIPERRRSACHRQGLHTAFDLLFNLRHHAGHENGRRSPTHRRVSRPS